MISGKAAAKAKKAEEAKLDEEIGEMLSSEEEPVDSILGSDEDD